MWCVEYAVRVWCVVCVWCLRWVWCARVSVRACTRVRVDACIVCMRVGVWVCGCVGVWACGRRVFCRLVLRSDVSVSAALCCVVSCCVV